MLVQRGERGCGSLSGARGGGTPSSLHGRLGLEVGVAILSAININGGSRRCGRNIESRSTGGAAGGCRIAATD